MTLRRASMLLFASALLAGCGNDPNSARATVRLRIVHGSVNTPSVDLLVDGQPAVSGIPFGTASEFALVEPGDHQIQLRETGATTALYNQTVTLAEGTAVTLVTYGPRDAIQVLTLNDAFSGAAINAERLRIVNVANGSGNLDAFVGTEDSDLAAPPRVTNLGVGTASSFVEVAPNTSGFSRVRLAPTGTRTVALDTQAFEITPGDFRTIIVLNAPGGGAPFGFVALTDTPG